MHLKSLTLKGFKSFASSTKLAFEPGITAVVGPNGSGKSNVVDAMAWVLGEQGAKALRGGKMHDVIFAGTAERTPLGRAEVTLVIDNRDGALPIEYDEVSITRRMFRDGAGEYEINGKACRLLDIQELLSDSGIGREMHVIVGQGHLDAVLSARPEDRRAFIEEAAGVLKHRKRKEKAARKLDGMRANMTRLTDLTSELGRQLGPLGKQAGVARRAAGIQADLRDAKLRLLADDAARLRQEMAADAAAEQAATEHREQVWQRLEAAQRAEQEAADAVAELTPRLSRAQDTFVALSNLAERFRGMTSLAEERAQHLAAPRAEPGAGVDPDELEAEAREADEEQTVKDAEVARAREALSAVITRRTERDEALAAVEAELARASRTLAQQREQRARLGGEADSIRSRLATGEDEIERLDVALRDAAAREATARDELEELKTSVGALDSSEVGLDEAHEQAQTASEAAQAAVVELVDRRARIESAQSGWRARVEALEMTLTRPDAAAMLLGDDHPRDGILGSVSELVTVRPGAEAAIAAALGPAAGAVAAAGATDVTAAIAMLKERDAGRAGFVIGGAPDAGETDGDRPVNLRDGEVDLPDGAVWAVDLVEGPGAVLATVRALLATVVIVDDVPAAADVVATHPELTAATREGDVFGSRWAYGGSGDEQSALEIQAAADEARGNFDRSTGELTEIDDAIARARVEAERCAGEAESALAALHESDAKIAAVTEQLAQLGAAAESARSEAERLTERRERAVAAHQDMREKVAATERQLAEAQSESTDGPPEVDTERRDELAAALSADRQAETDARLALRTAEERAQATAGHAERLRRRAAEQRETRRREAESRRRRAVGARVAGQVVILARQASERVADSLRRAESARDEAAAERAEAQRAATQARTEAAGLQKQWDELTSSVHSSEVARAQQELKWEQLTEAASGEFGLGAGELIDQFGPDVPVPPSAAEMTEYEEAKQRGEEVSAPAPMPFDRPSTERRAKRAQRDLNALGKVNPLALEEYAAMEERHAFLAAQLDDLTATRRDLLHVIDEVDEKIEGLFTSAYHDVAAEFSTVFATLFPGGSGALSLTDPDDMLATGIEVTARPPGKKVGRLSLLSGGERSLVAVAMLVAIFRARPSPFYVLDEVEAALDEVNLTRLVSLLRELRDSSQLIVITHQKYTMEAADVLYGVSMRGDGISQVISQRLDHGPAPRFRVAETAAGVDSFPEEENVG